MKLSAIFFKEYVIICGLILFFIVLSFFPTISHLYRTPKNSAFTFAYNFVPDYYQFLSWMKDGQRGEFAITSRYTAETYPRRYGHIFFPILGFIGSRLGMGHPEMFTLARVLLGIIRLLSIYSLILFFVKTKWKRIGMFLLVVSLPGFYGMDIGANHVSFVPFLYGITNFDVLRRITFLPHHLIANILQIIFFIIFSRAIDKRSEKLSLYSGIILFLASIANPAVILNMIIILSAAFLLIFVFLNERSLKLISCFLIAAAPLFASALYYQIYLFQTFPWNLFYQSEISEVRKLPVLEYAGSLGIALPLSLVGVFNLRAKLNTFTVLLISWGFAPILGFVMGMRFTFLSQFRIFQAQQSIPLGILAGFGLFYLLSFRRKRIYTILTIFTLVLISLPSYYLSYRQQFSEITPDNYFVYIPTSTIESFAFLDKNTPPESVVLGGYFMSQALPAYSHNRVFFGLKDRTVDYSMKIEEMTKFFSNTYSSSEVTDFVRRRNIAYILFGPDTPRPEATSLSKLSTKILYQNGSALVYQVL